MANLSMHIVKAVLVLGPDAERVMAQYFNSPHGVDKDGNAIGASPIMTKRYPSVQAERDFEKRLWQKTSKLQQDILIYDDQIVAYKECKDIIIYVIGSLEENEWMLFNVVSTIQDALELALRTPISKRVLLDNFDMLALCVDETVDDGIIIETDASIVASRLSQPPATDNAHGPLNIDLSERGLLNAWGKAKEEIADRLKNAF